MIYKLVVIVRLLVILQNTVERRLSELIGTSDSSYNR